MRWRRLHGTGQRSAVGDVPLLKGDVGKPMQAAQGYLGTLRRVGVGRLVLSLICAVYGTPERDPVGEDAPLHPESPNGESTAMTERALDRYDRCLGLRSVSLRDFNAAGAWPDGSMGEDWTVTINLVPLFMKAAPGRRGPLEVFGTDYPTPDGTAIRDPVHVVDWAEAHVRALEYLEGGGETTVPYLGTGQASGSWRPDSAPSVWEKAGPRSGRSEAGGVVPLRIRSPRGAPEPGSGGLQVTRGVLAERSHQLVERLVELPLVVGGAHVLVHGPQPVVGACEVGRRADDGDNLGTPLLESPCILLGKHLGECHLLWNPLVQTPLLRSRCLFPGQMVNRQVGEAYGTKALYGGAIVGPLCYREG